MKSCSACLRKEMSFKTAHIQPTLSHAQPIFGTPQIELKLIPREGHHTTPFCNWRWPIAKTDSTQEQNSAPHPAVGAERLADVRNNSVKFGFSSSFSITSTLCVKNGISSKQFGIHSKRFDKVPPTLESM